nr:hypothetical protein [Tanacetum cinerariifolium]
MPAGEWSEYDDLDENVQEIKKTLRIKQVMDVDEMYIKAAIEGAQHFFKAEEYSHFKEETSKDNYWSPCAEIVINNLSKDNFKDVFQKLLRTLEDSWLGPWKRMLAGEWSEYDDLDEKVQEIKRMLSENKVTDVDEMSIKGDVDEMSI